MPSIIWLPSSFADQLQISSLGSSNVEAPTRRAGAKTSIKYDVVISGDGTPLACQVTAAECPDTLLCGQRFLAAFQQRL